MSMETVYGVRYCVALKISVAVHTNGVFGQVEPNAFLSKTTATPQAHTGFAR